MKCRKDEKKVRDKRCIYELLLLPFYTCMCHDCNMLTKNDQKPI